jgi:hypothetical protein
MNRTGNHYAFLQTIVNEYCRNFFSICLFLISYYKNPIYVVPVTAFVLLLLQVLHVRRKLLQLDSSRNNKLSDFAQFIGPLLLLPARDVISC